MSTLETLRNMIEEKRAENILIFQNEEWNVGLDQTLGMISRIEREGLAIEPPTALADWVNVTEALPPATGTYLVTVPGIEMPVSWSFDAERHEWVSFCNHPVIVEAWMPLPRRYIKNAPKEESRR